MQKFNKDSYDGRIRYMIEEGLTMNAIAKEIHKGKDFIVRRMTMMGLKYVPKYEQNLRNVREESLNRTRELLNIKNTSDLEKAQIWMVMKCLAPDLTYCSAFCVEVFFERAYKIVKKKQKAPYYVYDDARFFKYIGDFKDEETNKKLLAMYKKALPTCTK